jgi:hypothetical protein
VTVYLGIWTQVDSNRLTVNLDQAQYADELLEQLGMQEWKSEPAPMVSRQNQIRNPNLKMQDVKDHM